MIILLVLAYHDRATFETNVASCGAASPSTTEFFLLVKYDRRFHYALSSYKSYKKIYVQF